MGYARRVSIAITTDSSGDFTANTEALTGVVDSIAYEPDGSSPLDTGADIVVAGVETGRNILTKANLGTSNVYFAPRQPTHSPADGSALVFALTDGVPDTIALANERLSVTISNGGNVLQGTIHIVVK